MENASYIFILGIVAGIFTSCSMIPQLVKTLQTKKSEHISPMMLLVLMSGVALWIVYGIIKKDWPIILTNAFSLLLNTIMLYLRWKYKDNHD